MFEMSAHYAFLDSSVDNVQTLPVASWIHQHSWTSSGRYTALWQSKFVIDWLLGTTDLDRWNLLPFFVHFNILLFLFFPGSTEADTMWGGNFCSHLMVRCIKTFLPNIIKIWWSVLDGTFFWRSFHFNAYSACFAFPRLCRRRRWLRTEIE